MGWGGVGTMKLNSVNVGKNLTVCLSQQQLDSDKKRRQEEENAETERPREERDRRENG